jgi:glycerol kinase
MPALLAIDQGTTSSRAILFDERGRRLAVAQRELQQHFPQAGWVEHDATRIWEDTLACVRDVLQNAALSAREVAAVGVTNQRETTVIWDRATGVPIHRAIVWQDRRTSEFCRQHQERGAWLAARTGLRLDPYFSATKIAWQLDHVDGARARAERGELAFGTIDSWLLWKLTGGRAHVTDATNASRTALFNLATQSWDDELLDFFGVPRTLLPEVLDSAADFGHTEPSLFGGSIAIGGVAGDQQAATVGQACFEPGMAKSTYGTGCFIVLNTGTQLKLSRNRLLSTVAYRLEGRPTYALEGSIFIAGAAVQWLRDSLHLISTAAETEQLAGSIDGSDGVYLVPAFTGLGAPYWDPDARGALLGLTRSTGIAEIARATLEAVAFQTRDLMGAMAEDALIPTELRVDGGMVVNNWLAQNLADMLQLPVVRPHTVETTALGAALLAGLTAGVFQSLEDISRLWEAERRFTPRMSRVAADRLQAGWLDAVRRVRSTSASH